MEELKKEIESCKTKKQLMDVLKEHDLRIERDDSDEVGCFSIWLDDLTRIYRSHFGNFVFQKWYRCQMNYSGTPVFSGNI